MRVVSFITEPSVIRQILDHLQNHNNKDPVVCQNSVGAMPSAGRELRHGRSKARVAPRAARIGPMQPHLLQLLVVTLAGWVNRFQQDAIEYLKEENRVLREHVAGRRRRFTDDQRRRLAAKARVMNAYAERFVRSIKSECRSLISDN